MAHNHRKVNEQAIKPVTSMPKSSVADMATQLPISSPAQALQSVTANPATLSPTEIFQLQRTAGNRAVGALLGNSGVQREKLRADTQQQESTQLQQLHESKPNNTGMPDDLKSGIENLSGFSMDNVRIHYNSPQPAQFNAFAYAQGAEIHLAPGQEKHLPHEAWHLVQQAQGRVKPTMQFENGLHINADKLLEKEADAMGTLAEQRSTLLNSENQEKPVPLLHNQLSETAQHSLMQTPSSTYVYGPRTTDTVQLYTIEKGPAYTTNKGRAGTSWLIIGMDGYVPDSGNQPTPLAKQQMPGAYRIRQKYGLTYQEPFAMHLINGRLGGSGNTPLNLAWGTHNMNVTHSNGWEKDRQQQARDNDDGTMEMEVTAHYKSDDRRDPEDFYLLDRLDCSYATHDEDGDVIDGWNTQIVRAGNDVVEDDPSWSGAQSESDESIDSADEDGMDVDDYQ